MRPFGVKKQDLGVTSKYNDSVWYTNSHPHRNRIRNVRMAHKRGRGRIRTSLHRFMAGNTNVFFDGI